MTIGEGSRGEGGRHMSFGQFQKQSLYRLRASEQVREPRLRAGSDRGRPQRAFLTKKMHHSQQIDEFLTQIAILRRDFEPHVTNYRKIPAFIDREGPPWTRGTYDGGVGGG